MAKIVLLPKMGQTMDEGTITKWLKKEGDKVNRGDLLLEVMTDKANLEVDSTDEGILRKIFVQENDTVAVLAPIAVIADADEDISGILKDNGSAPIAVSESQTQAKTNLSVQATIANSNDKIFVSPRARALANENNIEVINLSGMGTGEGGTVIEKDVLNYLETLKSKTKMTPVASKIASELGLSPDSISGTGSDGRVTKADVLDQSKPTPVNIPVAVAHCAGQSIPFTGRRKLTADAVYKSYNSAPHVTLMTEVDVTEFVTLRESIVGQVEKAFGVRISYTDMLVKAVAICMKQFPNMNATLSGNEIILWGDVNVGVAVAISGSLVVPVVKCADTKSITQISKECKQLIERARAGKSTPDDLSGGGFTITNLGTFGIDNFTPILTPGQAGILGVGRIVQKPAVVDGQLAIRSMMGLSLSFDHRVIDGAPAAEFLKTLSAMISSPMLMLL